MDRGYDSEAIHRLIREILHANSVIPLRSWNADFVGGTYRQEMATRFNDIIYPRRQLVENKFSVLKRKFSGDLKARKFLIQTKEIAGKMIVCNLHRFLQFLIVEVFYSVKIRYSLEAVISRTGGTPLFFTGSTACNIVNMTKSCNTVMAATKRIPVSEGHSPAQAVCPPLLDEAVILPGPCPWEKQACQVDNESVIYQIRYISQQLGVVHVACR